MPGDVVTICGEIKTIRTDELEGRRVYEKKSTFILYMEAHSITLVGGGKRKKKKHSAQPSNNSRFNTNDEDDDQVTPTLDVLVLLVMQLVGELGGVPIKVYTFVLGPSFWMIDLPYHHDQCVLFVRHCVVPGGGGGGRPRRQPQRGTRTCEQIGRIHLYGKGH